jgi:hypothetical protein
MKSYDEGESVVLIYVNHAGKRSGQRVRLIRAPGQTDEQIIARINERRAQDDKTPWYFPRNRRLGLRCVEIRRV